MWQAISSAPALALTGLVVLLVLSARSVRRRSGCNLSAFWFIVCLTAKGLRPRASSAPPCAPPCPPSADILRGRESMRRLIRLAAPLMSFAPQPPSLRRVPATIAGVRVRWCAAASVCYQKV